MRILSKKQKNAIDKIMKEDPEIYSIDDISLGQFQTIENMNPHETFWSNLTNYIIDKRY